MADHPTCTVYLRVPVEVPQGLTEDDLADWIAAEVDALDWDLEDDCGYQYAPTPPPPPVSIGPAVTESWSDGWAHNGAACWAMGADLPTITSPDMWPRRSAGDVPALLEGVARSWTPVDRAPVKPHWAPWIEGAEVAAVSAGPAQSMVLVWQRGHLVAAIMGVRIDHEDPDPLWVETTPEGAAAHARWTGGLK